MVNCQKLFRRPSRLNPMLAARHTYWSRQSLDHPGAGSSRKLGEARTRPSLSVSDASRVQSY